VWAVGSYALSWYDDAGIYDDIIAGTSGAGLGVMVTFADEEIPLTSVTCTLYAPGVLMVMD
jgi:hypothetical protein